MRTRDKTARRTALAGALALGGTVLLGGAKPAAATAFITECGYRITAPGTYILARDLTCLRGQDGITVHANNVHLVLGNHTITGPGSPPQFGVDVTGGTGLSVKGGTVTGFRVDIYIQNSPGARVNGTTTTDAFVGIALAGNCAGCKVAGSRASGNHEGIYVHSSNTRIADDTAKNNDIGINVVTGATGNHLTGNTALGNLDVDLRDNNPACVNTWRGNRFGTKNGAGAACIH